MRKFYTVEEFRHVKKEIEAEYFDKVYASKTDQEKVEMLFGRHCKVPNGFLQGRMEARGFLYDPLGDNVKQTLCCFDIYCVEIPQDYNDSDIDQMISNIRKERNLDSLRWVSAVRADTAIDAIQHYANLFGWIKEDCANPYLYNKRSIATVGKEKIAYFEKIAIFAK